MLQRSDVLVACRKLKREQAGDSWTFTNLVMGTKTSGPETLSELLDFFREPRSLAELDSAYEGIGDDIIHVLLDRFLLLRAADEPLFRYGVVFPPARGYGRVLNPGELHTLAKKPDSAHAFALVGAPVDVTAGGTPGARFGPQAIRSAMPVPFAARFYDLQMRREIDASRIELVDVGDVPYMPGESIQTFGQRLDWVTRRVRASGFIPIGLGGDHSVSRYLLRGVLETGAPFGLLHFDAHTDLYALDPDQHTHGNPFDEVLATPNLRVMRQIGLRQIEAPQGKPAPDERLSYRSAREVHRSSPDALFGDLPRDIPYYLTFDVDCMDPTECPETGTPVPGGLHYDDVLECFDYVLSHLRLLGMDFVEVALGAGHTNRAAALVAELLLRGVMSHGQQVPLVSQRFRGG